MPSLHNPNRVPNSHIDIRESFLDPGRYRMLGRVLIYLTMIRPDITFSISAVSQFFLFILAIVIGM